MAESEKDQIIRKLKAENKGLQEQIAYLRRKLFDHKSEVLNPNQTSLNNDFNLALLYVIFAQTLALKKSIKLGISPDNPSPDGAISRVVQGVTIYDYEK